MRQSQSLLALALIIGTSGCSVLEQRHDPRWRIEVVACVETKVPLVIIDTGKPDGTANGKLEIKLIRDPVAPPKKEAAK